MKLVLFFVAFWAIVFSVSAKPTGTNGERMARGLPPLPPVRRATPAEIAKRGHPSSSPGGSCNTGPVQCCNEIKIVDSALKVILGLLGIHVSNGASVGFGCSPITVIGLGGSHCSAHPVCCTNNGFSGGISVGCSPINL